MRDALSSTRCAEMLKALADEDRLRLVQLLREGPQSVTALAESLNAELANVSHHLKILRRHGVVEAHRQGRNIIYQLHPRVFQASRTARDHLDLGCCRLEIPR